MTKAASMPAFPAVRTLADVEAIERTPRAERLDAESTYEVLRVETPKVAILAAVETVNSKMPATLDAATLCGRTPGRLNGRSHSQPPVKPARRRPATTGGERRMRFQSKPLR